MNSLTPLSQLSTQLRAGQWTDHIPAWVKKNRKVVAAAAILLTGGLLVAHGDKLCNAIRDITSRCAGPVVETFKRAMGLTYPRCPAEQKWTAEELAPQLNLIIEEIGQNRAGEHGIFRIGGSRNVVDEKLAEYNEDGRISNLRMPTPDLVSLLKALLTRVEGGLIPQEGRSSSDVYIPSGPKYKLFCLGRGVSSSSASAMAKDQQYKEIIAQLPGANRAILNRLLECLSAIARIDGNEMDAKNLATCIALSVFAPASDPREDLRMTDGLRSAMEYMINHAADYRPGGERGGLIRRDNNLIRRDNNLIRRDDKFTWTDERNRYGGHQEELCFSSSSSSSDDDHLFDY